MYNTIHTQLFGGESLHTTQYVHICVYCMYISVCIFCVKLTVPSYMYSLFNVCMFLCRDPIQTQLLIPWLVSLPEQFVELTTGAPLTDEVKEVCGGLLQTMTFLAPVGIKQFGESLQRNILKMMCTWCVCVCACARVRACVCVCVCIPCACWCP